MKTVYSALLFFLIQIIFISTKSQGQDSTGDGKDMIGIHGGVNLSTFHGNTDFFYSTKTGLSVGIFYQKTTNYDDLDLCIELNYERKGALYDYNGITFNSDFDYLTVPLLIKYYINENKVRIIFIGGAYIGFLLSPPDEYEYYHPIDAGLTGGLGVNIKISKILCVSVEVRENYGILPLQQNSNSNNSVVDPSISFKNQSVVGLVGIAYLF